MHDTQAMTRQQQRITGGHLAHRSRGVTALVLARGGPGLPSSDLRHSGPLVTHDLRPAWISGVHAPADVVAGSEVAAGCLVGGNPWPSVAVTTSMASRTPFPPWWRRRGSTSPTSPLPLRPGENPTPVAKRRRRHSVVTFLKAPTLAWGCWACMASLSGSWWRPVRPCLRWGPRPSLPCTCRGGAVLHLTH